MDSASRGFPPGDIRVSDADRDQAVEELSEAFRVGRITADEFEQRSEQALSARTGRELIAPLADLPPRSAPMPRASAAAEASRVAGARRVMVASTVGAVAFSAIAATNALSTGVTLAQREFMQRMAARQGIAIPLPPNPGFNWAGTLVPATVAILFVVLIVFLHVTRADRHRP